MDDSVAIKYKLGSEEIAEKWNELDFNDSNWTDGFGSIGWGDGDDSTTLSQRAPSLFVRFPFNVEDTSAINDVQLDIEFDDGFIAYINGFEIARVNMGAKGETADFDRLADRSHETATYRSACTALRGYFIDGFIIDSCLNQGDNILAIQVHNDSINGSDLSLKAKLIAINHNIMDPYLRECQSIRQVPLDSSHLPIIEINTDEFSFNECKVWIDASMKVMNNGTNKLTDTDTEYSGLIGIKTRGNSSLGWPKKQYSIELRNPAGEDSAVSLLGMPKESDWILQSSFADRSLIRNALAFAISKKTGEYAPRNRHCELVLNGEYLGVYQLVEKIKRDANRVDIKKLNPFETSGIDLTGGYIFRYDKETGARIGVTYPNDDKLDDIQEEYIHKYVDKYVKLAKHESFLEFDTTYRDFMDPVSYINYTITNEIAKNADAYRYSTYQYKDRDDIDPRIHFGPVWDFDLAFGNTTFQEGNLWDRWQWQNSGCRRLWHTYIFRDTVIVNQYKDRWQELRASALTNDSIFFLMDSLIEHLGTAIDRNYQVWPVENKKLTMWGFNFSYNYDEEITLMKQWLTDRLDWMDRKTGLIYRKYDPKPLNLLHPNSLQVQFGPNPATADIRLSFNSGTSTEASIAIFTSTGIKTKDITTNAINGKFSETIDIRNLPSGIYNIRIRTATGESNTLSFIKE